MKTHMIGDNAVEMSDAAIVAVKGLQTEMGRLTADNLKLTADLNTASAAHATAIQAKDAAHATEIKAKDTELATKDAEIEKLKANQIDDAKIDALAAERGDVIGKARSVLDSAKARGVQVADLKTVGVPLKDIRRTVVSTVLGDAAIKDKSDDYVDVRFDILAEDAAKRPDALGRAISDSLPNPGQPGAPPVILDSAAIQAKRNRELADAWKQAPAGAA